MRRAYSTVLLAGLACLLVFASAARAGVTIDVVFRDATTPSGIAIQPGDPGPGCTFSGYYGSSVSTGYCMDAMLYTTDPLIAVSFSVEYDTDNGLAVSSLREWTGTYTGEKTLIPVCIPMDGIADNGGLLQHFDCLVEPPNDPPVLEPGTYRLGTIIWDTSGTHTGADNLELISVVFAAGDGVSIPLNGNISIPPQPPVLKQHTLTIIPEPGTAGLLGLGFASLVLAARRRRAAGL